MTGANLGQSGSALSIDIVLSVIVAAIILYGGRKNRMQLVPRVRDQLMAL